MLLVLQHICLYCSSATSRSSNEFLLDEAQPPITVVPKRGRSISTCIYDDEPNLSAPSAPPLPTISENEEEDHPLLYQDEIMLLEDADEREFEAGMAVSGSKGRKVRCTLIGVLAPYAGKIAMTKLPRRNWLGKIA